MKKRLLCSFLAVMMLISMLAGIVVPVSADEASPYPQYSNIPADYTGKDFAISSVEDWTAAMAETANDVWTGVTLHVTTDIDFSGVAMSPLYAGKEFKGTIDGHGHVFKNISMTNGSSTDYTNPGLVGNLGGTIKNLGIVGGNFKNTTNYARVGAFAPQATASAVLYKCWSDATIEGAKGDHLGGLVGTATSATTLDGCYFTGAVKGGSGTASALIGYGGAAAKIYNCIGAGTVTGANGSTGMIRMHANIYTNGISAMPIYNSYAVGMKVLNYNGTPSDPGKTVNGHAYNDTTLQSTYVANSLVEAAWKVNAGTVGYKDSGKGLERVYYKLDADKGITYGSATDRIQKITSKGLVAGDFYFNVGDKVTVADFTSDANASFFIDTAGYEDAIKDGVLTVPNADITIRIGVPYSQKDTCSNANSKTWTIASAADWIKLTNDFNGKSCSYTLYVTKDIDFENTNMKPLSYGSGIVTSVKIYGQGHTFQNIKIEMEGGTNQYQGVSLVGALGAGGIYDLGVTGNIYNTSTSTAARTAVFSGGATAGNSPVIKNCWADVYVKGPSSNRAQYLSVYFATADAKQKIENCINYGTVESTTSDGAAAVFYSYGAQVAMKNCLDLGTTIGSSASGSIASHHNGIGTFINANSYSTGNFWGWTHPGYESEIKTQNVTIPGTTTVITTAQQVRDYLAVGSAAEAAWRATDGANGAVYYKLDATKGVVFGTKTDRVQKVTFAGLESIAGKAVYLNVGSTLDLDGVLLNAGITDSVVYSIVEEDYANALIDDYTVKVPNADITVNVAVDDTSIAKEQLKVNYDVWVTYNPAYFVEGEALSKWLADVEAVMGKEKATMDEINPLLATATGMTFTLKDNTYIPYSENKTYSAIDNKVWSISTKAEWIALTEDYYNKNCDLTLYVTKDIDFEETNMQPLCYSELPDGPNAKFFTGKLYGQGYTFKNIKIEMEGGNNQYQGVSLISGLCGEIHDLGLTGSVTNTSTEVNSCTAAFAAGAITNVANGGLIKNCWADVTVKGNSNGRALYLGVFYSHPNAKHTLENCINYGTVQTTAEGGGAAVFYPYGAQVTMKNCLDLGTIIGSGSGVCGAIASHHNGIGTFIKSNSFSVNNFWGWTHSGYEHEIAGYNLKIPGTSTAITGSKQVKDYFAVDSAAEAAWRATNGANGEVYYKLDETGKVVYGTETDRVWRVAVTNGSVVTNYYGMEGDTITLDKLPADMVRVVSGATVEGDTLTIGKSDATVAYKFFEEVDATQLKKKELQNKINSYNKYNPEFIGNMAAIEAWISASEAVIADPYATLADVQAKVNAAPALVAAELTYPNYPSIKDYDLYKSFISDFAVATKADWNIFITCGSSFKAMTVHVVNDIDFENALTKNSMILEGTLDGHGHVLKNLNIDRTGSGQAGLIAELNRNAIIKNLGLTGTLTTSTTASNVGSFAGYALGKISGCWSTMTIDVTDNGSGHIGGLVGRGSGCVVENSYFAGEVIGEPTYGAGGIIGYGEGVINKVKNCFVAASGVAGTDRVYPGTYQNITDFNAPAIDSYVAGAPAFDLRHTDGIYNDVMAALADNAGYKAYEAKYSLSADAYTNGKLAYKMNENSAETGVYYTVKAGKTVFGSATDKVVKITIDGDVFYAATGTRIAYTLNGSDALVVESGDAKVNGNIVTAGVEDAVINVGGDDDSLLAAAKNKLENLLALYNAREAKYFTSASWTAQTAWKATAEAAIAANTMDAINAAIEAEASVSKAAASMNYPNYPSIADYKAYKGTGVKNLAIGSKAEWLAAVAMSTGAGAENFNGMTLHLTADIDMENVEMLPLCYGGIFTGNFDGHFYAFKNIYVHVDMPEYPVGLIGELSGWYWIRNLGIDSGIVEVTGDEQTGSHEDGTPIYRSYKAGGIVGKTGGSSTQEATYIRKCWNAAQVKVSHCDNVAGIVGDGRSLPYIDSCINLGKVSGGYGISGYAAATTKIYNCVDLGITYGLAQYHANLFKPNYSVEDLEGKYIFNSWAKTKIVPRMNISADVMDDEKTLIDNIMRALNNKYQVGTAEEAAWAVNQGYVSAGLADKSRAWFVVDENGKLAFGSSEDQPHKVTINFMEDGVKVSEQVYFAAPGQTIELNGELGASYFVVKSASTATLKGNMLTMGYEDVILEGQCGIHVGDASADANVNLFDAITVLRSIVGLADCGMAGDVNQNGRLDANDAVLIARYWLGDPNAKFVETKPVDLSNTWLKVASYNVKLFKFDGSYSGGNPGDKLGEIAEILKSVDADVVGLQEVYEEQVAEIAAAAGYEYSYFTFASQKEFLGFPVGRKYGTAILSKYAIKESATVEFNNEDVLGQPPEGLSEEPRSYGRVVLDVNGKDVAFYNTHLAGRQGEMLAYIMDKVNADVEAGLSVVVTGDFNYSHDEVRAVVGSDATVLNRNLESTVDNSYIDNIIVSNNMDFYWDNTTGNGVKVIDSDASDHSLIYGYACLK